MNFFCIHLCRKEKDELKYFNWQLHLSISIPLNTGEIIKMEYTKLLRKDFFKNLF